MNLAPNNALLNILLEAYRPCENFGLCREAIWNPDEGHIPRGFLGATGELEDIEVVMIFAEPGHAHGEEQYDPKAEPLDLLMSGVRHTYNCFSSGHDLFHRNARWFISNLFPDLSFDQQLRHVWMTEGRLCSIANEIGNVRDRTCARSFLIPQLELLPQAAVVAFGGKAQDYLKGQMRDWLRAYALAPPGANHTTARPSWEAAIAEIKARRLSFKKGKY